MDTDIFARGDDFVEDQHNPSSLIPHPGDDPSAILAPETASKEGRPILPVTGVATTASSHTPPVDWVWGLGNDADAGGSLLHPTGTEMSMENMEGGPWRFDDFSPHHYPDSPHHFTGEVAMSPDPQPHFPTSYSRLTTPLYHLHGSPSQDAGVGTLLECSPPPDSALSPLCGNIFPSALFSFPSPPLAQPPTPVLSCIPLPHGPDISEDAFGGNFGQGVAGPSSLALPIHHRQHGQGGASVPPIQLTIGGNSGQWVIGPSGLGLYFPCHTQHSQGAASVPPVQPTSGGSLGQGVAGPSGLGLSTSHHNQHGQGGCQALSLS
ncbi:hypothetical protein JAAARDRAFT_406539 [Jaapia argillacea MUCL 33604]|uniref:Uncharacterized protein n=1 Tax=Jaapia argillacea MUCL 33604 TaxID=933084 RepID=A0A067PVM8_9AGAM|nr:hypothetical protein JAAARDRAFT_406539 [Jaapia argillacea MUCL 33604]